MLLWNFISICTPRKEILFWRFLVLAIRNARFLSTHRQGSVSRADAANGKAAQGASSSSRFHSSAASPTGGQTKAQANGRTGAHCCRCCRCTHHGTATAQEREVHTLVRLTVHQRHPRCLRTLRWQRPSHRSVSAEERTRQQIRATLALHRGVVV